MDRLDLLMQGLFLSRSHTHSHVLTHSRTFKHSHTITHTLSIGITAGYMSFRSEEEHPPPHNGEGEGEGEDESYVYGCSDLKKKPEYQWDLYR